MHLCIVYATVMNKRDRQQARHAVKCLARSRRSRRRQTSRPLHVAAYQPRTRARPREFRPGRRQSGNRAHCSRSRLSRRGRDRRRRAPRDCRHDCRRRHDLYRRSRREVAAHSSEGNLEFIFMTKDIRKIVLAYSGGLDTSVMLHWLKEQYQCEVVCYCADVGQGAEMEGLEEKAKATGGSKLYVEELREEFVRDYVWTSVKANAVYEGVYLMGTSLARPVIAKRQIEIARQENADAVAHGATGKGNDQVRFELTYYALQPDIKVIAPWREWEFGGRTDLIAYAEAHGIPVTATIAKPYSTDANLMHISYEGGILEEPWAEPPEDIFQDRKSTRRDSSHTD